VTAHCGAQPPALIEAVLFGQEKEKEKEKEKGAIGAAPDKLAGKFAEAHGGTLFLDGIDELPLEAQVKLLRALQDGEIEPVGARKPARVDVRIVAATGRNLIERVKQGRFREDLYYRLNVFPISMPPLRARRADIADLARRFLARFSAEEGKRVRGLTAESLALLSSYDWPGNVRQLENAIFRAVVLAEGDELTVAEFPQIAAQVEGFDVRIPSAPPPVGLRETQREIVRVEVRDPNVLRLLDENGDVRRLDRLEEEAIRFALSHYRGRMSEMARKLGIGRSTLYRKMKDYGLAEGDDVNAA
jgi:DNA-binding NtrC family response regulator